MFELLTPDIAWVMIATLEVLLVAGIAYLLLNKKSAQPLPLSIRENLVHASWALFFICLPLLANQNGALLLYALLSYFCFKDYLNVLPPKPLDSRLVFWALLCVPLQYGLIASQCSLPILVLASFTWFILLGLRTISIQGAEDFLKTWLFMSFGAVLCVYSLSHFALLITQIQSLASALIFYMLLLCLFYRATQRGLQRYHHRWPINVPLQATEDSEKSLLSLGYWDPILLAGLLTIIAGVLIAPIFTPLTLIESMLTSSSLVCAYQIVDSLLLALHQDQNAKLHRGIFPHGWCFKHTQHFAAMATLLYYLYWGFWSA
ncbi:MAG: hypothetical protein H0W44_09500 [Gammaproteobacteria bacterium]|nr:hypothetical protein [Gammaproteobacteria bacterium]